MRDSDRRPNDVSGKLDCPSAQPDMGQIVVFGVVGGTVTEPRVGYLKELQPATDDVLALANPASPTEVFRLSAPCAGVECKHFDGSQCQLGQRLVSQLWPVIRELPVCRLRPTCRWWHEQGRNACYRCPQIVTETHQASEVLRQIADPSDC